MPVAKGLPERRGLKWTDRDEALLGTDLDRLIAVKLNRTPNAVTQRRIALGIPAYSPRQYQWSKREVSLLGSMSDDSVANKLGISRRAVGAERRRRKIECFSPNNRPNKFD